MASSSTSQAHSEAPEHPLPSTSFFSIEYPGYVQPSSIPTAVNNLGGQSSLENAFKRTATKADALLELSLRPNNPFSHPVPGDVVGTSNLLMKVVKKKRKGVDKNGSAMGEYTAQVVGVIPKTVRFRSECSDFIISWSIIDSGCRRYGRLSVSSRHEWPRSEITGSHEQPGWYASLSHKKLTFINFAPVFISWCDTSLYHPRRERRLPHPSWPRTGSSIINRSVNESSRPVDRPE